MSLRLKLLLVALSTLALPWAGWQFVRQTEALLRQGQEQAALASAGMLAKALDARGIDLPATDDALYVQRLDEPLTIDGYADDWRSLLPFSQSLGPAQDPSKLRVVLARNVGGLYLLAQVRDATRTRVDPASPLAPDSDHVTLVLEQQRQIRTYLLSGAAPGSFSAPARGTSPGDLPDALAGSVQEDGSGYRIELRLPRGIAPDRIGIGVYDAAQPAADAPELRPLVGYDAAIARDLAPLVPYGARARIVSEDGWLLAASGQLAATVAKGEESGWIAGAIYRNLLAPAFGGSAALTGSRPRLDAPEVWQALSGVPATTWRAGAQEGVVVLTAVVPLPDRSNPRAALVLEQASRALPSLANRALLGLAVATLSALAIAGLILLAFGVSLSLRIRRLRNAAERATRGSGRLDGPMPLIDAPDELGDLARSFARLVDEVAAYTEYLRTLASKLSHELNTPLAIVKSSLDNLDHAELPDQARPYLERARDGADRLGAIVRAMSEANRIERAIAAADVEDFDLRALVEGCAGSYRDLIGPRELRLELPDTPVPMHGAPDLIAQALDKLFDNACSFTPDDGWIGLSLQVLADCAVLRVANAGPLLRTPMQERLFDSLVSLRERSAREGGAPHLGLGLYVVRLVAKLHRGHARAANLPGGEGVMFEITLAGMPRQRLSHGTNLAASGD